MTFVEGHLRTEFEQEHRDALMHYILYFFSWLQFEANDKNPVATLDALL